MNDIFQEIKEDLQQEKVLKFFKKYQKQLSLFATTAAVLGVVYLFWQHRDKTIREDSSDSVMSAVYYLSTQNEKKALSTLDTIPQKSGNAYSDLSKLLAAGLLAKNADHKAAIESYENLIKSASFKELEALGVLRLLYTEFDKLDAQSASHHLALLLNDKKAVWYPFALELQGMFYIKEKDLSKAKSTFEELLMVQDVSEPQKTRAELALSYLAGKH